MRTRALAASALGLTLAAGLLATPAAATDPNPAPTVTIAPTDPTNTPKFRNSCKPTVANLPTVVEGRPAAFQGAAFVPHSLAKGLYVWHEQDGWHVRLTHNAAPVTDTAVVTKPQLIEVGGRITASRSMTAVRRVRLEAKQRGEWVAVERPGRRGMTFRFVNAGWVDGIDFRAGCAGRLTFAAWEVTRNADGTRTRTPLPVFVGATSVQVTDTAATANPGLVPSATEITRMRILRTPVV